MKVIDLIKDMYEGKLPIIVSFNMNGDRYTAFFSETRNTLEIEDYNQDEICITNYYDEVEILEDTPKEDKKIDKIDVDWQNVFDEQAQQDFAKMVLNKINEIIDKVNGE